MRHALIVGWLALGVCGFPFASDAKGDTASVPSPVARVSKKGACGDTGGAEAKTWSAKVADLNVSWHYSWGYSLPMPEPRGVEFVPMVWSYWGKGKAFSQTIDDLKAGQAGGRLNNLLGFNEPDGKEQANLTVEQALEAWPELQRTKLRLGSPAPVHADGEWMKSFMAKAKAKGYRVDFVCVHSYPGPSPDAFIKYIETIHKLYGKPIWITEFAVADWQAKSLAENRFSEGKVLEFMKAVLPRLDQLDFVERYAWFGPWPENPALGTSSLFKPDGTLSALGKFYAQHGSQ